jgi:hypothetical protein
MRAAPSGHRQQCDIDHILPRSRLLESRDTTETTNMKNLAYAALLSGFGAITLAGTLGSSVPAAAKCTVDEGNGRYTPCDAHYYITKCMVDDGNGRYTPCSASAKKTTKQQ